jgi:hypothetical protein
MEPGPPRYHTLEALGRHAGRELRGQHLDHDRPAEGGLVRGEDARHAPAPELAVERVGVGQRRLQAIAEVSRHDESPEWFARKSAGGTARKIGGPAATTYHSGCSFLSPALLLAGNAIGHVASPTPSLHAAEIRSA